MQLKTLPLKDVGLGRTNVRRREITADLDDLARSIQEIGQQQPIVVQPRRGRYEVLIGQRRYLAAKKLGLASIVALVPSRPFDETEAVLVSLSENVHRRDLEPADKAEAIAFLHQELGGVSAVAKRVGISEPTVRKWLGYRAVPEPLRRLVEEKKISVPTALRITQHIPEVDRAEEMARYLAEKQPPPAERTRILDALVENADRPLKAILERAEEAKDVLEINFVLSSRWARTMNAVVDETHREASEIARDATIDWLERQRP